MGKGGGVLENFGVKLEKGFCWILGIPGSGKVKMGAERFKAVGPASWLELKEEN